jgi:hypothetical protein
MATNYYTQQANDFAKKYNVKLHVFHNETEYRPYFSNEKECRYVFKCRLVRGRRSYTFRFGQSLAEGSNAPSLYDILACLTKYDCGTFEDFCNEFGYEVHNDFYTGHNKESMKIYKAVCREYKAVCRLFGDSDECFNALCEIQ